MFFYILVLTVHNLTTYAKVHICFVFVLTKLCFKFYFHSCSLPYALNSDRFKMFIGSAPFFSILVEVKN